MGWERADTGQWLHRPWWKVAVNTVLRWLQPFADRKVVVFTRCTYIGDESGECPDVLGYGIGRVLHRSVG